MATLEIGGTQPWMLIRELPTSPMSKWKTSNGRMLFNYLLEWYNVSVKFESVSEQIDTSACRPKLYHVTYAGSLTLTLIHTTHLLENTSNVPFNINIWGVLCQAFAWVNVENVSLHLFLSLCLSTYFPRNGGHYFAQATHTCELWCGCNIWTMMDQRPREPNRVQAYHLGGPATPWS